MRLTTIHCDGCGRTPTFLEWVRGEFTTDGYREWRHPGIAFRDAGMPITYDNRTRCQQLFFTLFGRPLPEEADYLCPHCQERAAEELPALIAEMRGDGQWTIQRNPHPGW